jgi:glycosyltransferase involved in cell wall biosynthesis
MRQRAATLGIADRVCFAGARRDVPLLMTTVINVCVLPSHHEGLSLAALEAQAAGLPLVLSEGLTREGDVVPELISRLPLEAGAEAWAAGLCGSAAAGRPLSRGEALARMNASPFAIDRSVERVLALYERG